MKLFEISVLCDSKSSENYNSNYPTSITFFLNNIFHFFFKLLTSGGSLVKLLSFKYNAVKCFRLHNAGLRARTGPKIYG